MYIPGIHKCYQAEGEGIRKSILNMMLKLTRETKHRTVCYIMSTQTQIYLNFLCIHIFKSS